MKAAQLADVEAPPAAATAAVARAVVQAVPAVPAVTLAAGRFPRKCRLSTDRSRA